MCESTPTIRRGPVPTPDRPQPVIEQLPVVSLGGLVPLCLGRILGFDRRQLTRVEEHTSTPATFIHQRRTLDAGVVAREYDAHVAGAVAKGGIRRPHRRRALDLL